MLCISFSPCVCVCEGPANTGVWSHSLHSLLATVVRGNPCLAFQTASGDGCICAASSNLPCFFAFFWWGWKRGNKREVRQLTASIISDFCLTPASSARASTHEQTHTQTLLQTKGGQPASVYTLWRPFIICLHHPSPLHPRLTSLHLPRHRFRSFFMRSV